MRQAPGLAREHGGAAAVLCCFTVLVPGDHMRDFILAPEVLCVDITI